MSDRQGVLWWKPGFWGLNLLRGGLSIGIISHLHCLYSIAMVPTAIPQSLLLMQYYFGLWKPWETESQLAFTTWAVPPNKSFFISNYEITAHKNSANSYNSNSTKYMRICGLYMEIQNLPGCCLHKWRNTWLADLGVTGRMLYFWKGILMTNSAPLESRKSDQWKWRKGRIMRGMVNAGGKTGKRGLCT